MPELEEHYADLVDLGDHAAGEGDSVLHSDCGVGTGSDGTCTCTEGG